jgi:hypothetical protein
MLRRHDLALGLGAVIVVGLAACARGPGTITVSLDASKGACKEIHLPEWPAPSGLPQDPINAWDSLVREIRLSGLDFRAEGTGALLVGLFVTPLGVNKTLPPIYSPAKHRLDLSTGKVQQAQDGEWESSTALSPYRDSTVRAIDMKPEYKLIYNGKEFPKRGAQWPLRAESAARLSPDGNFLTINSWDGSMQACPSLPLTEFLCREQIEGLYYFDIYNTRSAAPVLLLSGKFHRLNPDDLFERSTWISGRYYVLPLDSDKMARFVVCDLDQADSRER